MSHLSWKDFWIWPNLNFFWHHLHQKNLEVVSKKHGGGVKSWNFGHLGWLKRFLTPPPLKKSWRCQKNYHRDFWIWPSQSTRAFCTGDLAFFYLNFFWHRLQKKTTWRWCHIWFEKIFWIWPTLSFFLTPPPSKKTWRWCQILILVYFFGGGGIIFSEAEAYVEIVYIDKWMLEYIPPVHFIYTTSK